MPELTEDSQKSREAWALPEAFPSAFPEEDRASVRRTFVILAFVGACLCLPPRQWISAGILGVISGILLYRHVRLTRREVARRPKPAAIPVETEALFQADSAEESSSVGNEASEPSEKAPD